MDDLNLFLSMLERAQAAREVSHEQSHDGAPVVWKDADLLVKSAACGCKSIIMRQLSEGMAAGPMRRQAANN